MDTQLKSLTNELLRILLDLRAKQDRAKPRISEHVEADTLKELDTTLLQSLVAVRNLQNNLPTIHKLPPEVLAIVFDECRSPLPSLPGALFSREDSPNEAYLPIYEWINLSHVCHYWRETALSFPFLWNMVLFDTNIFSFEGSKVIFERSGTVPIDLFISDVPNDETTWLKTMLSESSSRLKSLHMHPRLLSNLQPNISYPRITQFIVFPWYWIAASESPRDDEDLNDDSDDAAPFERLRAVVQDGAPNITQVCLHGIEPLMRADVQGTLTHLCIMFNSAQTVSLDALLDVLAKYQALEELIISFPTLTPPVDLPDVGDIREPVQLQNLRSLVLNQVTPGFSSSFLSRTDLPEDMKLRILGMPLPCIRDGTGSQHSIAYALSPSFIKKMFPSITQLFLLCRGYELSFSASTAPGVECQIEIHFTWFCNYGDDYKPGLEIASSLGHYLPLDKIQKLDFDTDASPMYPLEQPFFWWFSLLTSLQSLCYDADLNRPYTPGSPIETEEGTYPTATYLALLSSRRYPQFPSPSLKELIVTGVGTTDNTCLGLREVLEKRRNAGLPINKVTFVVFVDEDESKPDSKPVEEAQQKVNLLMEGLSGTSFEVIPRLSDTFYSSLEPSPMPRRSSYMFRIRWRDS
ncbi:hypothetical protein C8Q75DRAFT_775196 [Abortiporus biennis]|nr:hypothetical protein C8Q75DRAFT_775196 [Abortiporus biennis]